MKFNITIKATMKEATVNSFAEALAFCRSELSAADHIEADDGSRDDDGIEAAEMNGEWVICANCDAVANTRREFAFISKED